MPWTQSENLDDSGFGDINLENFGFDDEGEEFGF